MSSQSLIEAGKPVTRVDLYRYVCPVHASRSHLPSFGLVVRVHAEAVGQEVAGVGESFVLADKADSAWALLKSLGKGLLGSKVTNGISANDPLGEIAAWQPVRNTDRGWQRSAKLAVEMAILDLKLKVAGKTIAELWGGLSRSAPTLAPTAWKFPNNVPVEEIDEALSRLQPDAKDSPLAKLRLTGTLETDLVWLRKFSRAFPDQMLWVQSAANSDEDDRTVVTRVIELMRKGEVSARVFYEGDLPRQRPRAAKLMERTFIPQLRGRSAASRLQEAADRLTRTDNPTVEGRRLVVVAGAESGTLSQLRWLSRGWPVGAVYLSLPHWGSLLKLRDAAVLAKKLDPSTIVILGGARGSRITQVVLERLAAAIPEIDMYLPEELSSKWPSLLKEEQDHTSEGGLLAPLDVSELVRYADRFAFLPETGPAKNQHEWNRYPNHPLLWAPSGFLRSLLLETEVLQAGFRTRRFDREFFLAEGDRPDAVIGFSESEFPRAGFAASMITVHKGATRRLLASHGLPIPDGHYLPSSEIDKAYQTGLALGFPLVVKPAAGSKGWGVTTGIRTAEELTLAIDAVKASRYGDTGIIIERHASGSDYRIIATPEEVVSVVRRDPASVVGDGKHTIEELVLMANAIRRQNPHLGKRHLIPLDERADLPLQRQGLSRESVPGAGQRVLLSTVANVSQGGDSYEVLEETNHSILEMAKRAVAAVPGLAYAGLDVLMGDHRLDVASQEVFIIEVNPKPVQTMHHFPMYGPPRNVSEFLVRKALKTHRVSVTPDSVEQLAVELEVTGKVSGVSYRRWFVRTASQLGITGWVTRTPNEDSVHAVIQGTPSQVGLMLRLAFSGPPGSRVAETYSRPIPPVKMSGFVVKR